MGFVELLGYAGHEAQPQYSLSLPDAIPCRMQSFFFFFFFFNKFLPQSDETLLEKTNREA